MKTYLSLALIGSFAMSAVTALGADNAASPWDAIAERAQSAKPGVWSADRAALQERDSYKKYYESFKDWTAPAPQTPPNGKLSGLRDKPTSPRFPITDKVWPQKAGDASICLWEDDKTAAYSFSIDDNNAADVDFWINLSKKYGDLKITWNLITINIDGTFSKGRVVSAGTWDLWRSVVGQGYHVASHSVSHVANPVTADGWPGPAWEILESIHALDEHLPTRKTKLFAYPGSAIKEFNGSFSWRGEITKYVAAARGFSGNPISPANQIDYYDIRSTSNPTGILPGPDMRFADFNITNIINANAEEKFKKFYRGWVTTFIHSVNGGKDWGQNPYTKSHIAVFDWVTSHRDEIWIGFLDDIALYGQERDTATLKMIESSESKIILSLSSQMDPTVFNYPLTIKVCVPSSWSSVTATQNQKNLELKALSHNGTRYVLIKALPDNGDIALTPQGAN